MDVRSIEDVEPDRRAQRHGPGVVDGQVTRDEGDHRRRVPRAGQRVRGGRRRAASTPTPTRPTSSITSCRARGIMTIDGEDRDIAQGDLVHIPPDKVHSLRPVSDHAPIHCFCFAIGVKGAGPIDYTTLALEWPEVLVTRQLPEGGLDPLLRRGPRHGPTARRRPLHHRRAGRRRRHRRRHRVPPHRPHRRAPSSRPGAAGRAQGGRQRRRRAIDNVDVAAARRLGIAVCNTPGVLDQTTADLAFLLILAASRLASEAEARPAGRRAGRVGASTTTWATTSTARSSAWSATAASGARWPGGPRASAWRSSTTPATNTGFPGLRGRRSTSCSRPSDIVSLHVPLSPSHPPPHRRPPSWPA